MAKHKTTAQNISSQSAFKTLEVILHSLENKFSRTVSELQKDQGSLSTKQRLLLTDLNDSITHTKILLKDALRHRANVANNNFTFAEQGVAEQIQVEKVLSALASTTSAKDFQEFCNFCVKTLAELYESQYAFIGMLQPGGEQVQTLAVWAGDHFADNFEYDLAGTPCEDVINLNKELIPTHAAQLYPEDTMLVSMQVDSYFGAPIIDKEAGTLGLVSVMDTSPMHLNEWIAPVLGVFAARLALELQRIKIVNELRAVNNRLEARVVERTAALQKSNDELRAFSYSVSHDLRTPVRTINSFLSIVYEDHLQNIPTEAIDHLDRIQRAGIKLNSLIDDLLSLARITEKSILLKKFDLTKLIYETCDELMLLYAERNIILHVDANLSAWADEGLVRILMFNLISNALKYTRDPDQSKIEIGVIKEVIPTYFVRDNGIGMDMAYAAKIFQPFQRLHNESEFSGNGVGLATVQRIIDRHGGKIWVHSQPEQGSTFFFTLGDQKPIS